MPELADTADLGVPSDLLGATSTADIEARGNYSALTRALGDRLPEAPEIFVGPGVETLRASGTGTGAGTGTGTIVAVAALIVQNTDLSADPAAVLQRLAAPVAIVDGVRATPHRWASVLYERLESAPA